MGWARILWVFAKLGFQNEAAYRANFWVQIFESALNIASALAAVGLVFHWTDELAGWRPPELVALLGVYFTVYGAIHGDLAENLAHKAMMQVVLLPALAALALVFRPHARLELWSLLLFLPALALAFALRFLFEWVVALACFWTTRITAVNQTYFAVLFFLSGRVAPLAILPHALQVTAAALPFRWMVAFPVELALGRLTPSETLVGLGAQLGWIAASGLLLAAIWPRALRRFSSVGG